jgi:hypothetical protein
MKVINQTSGPDWTMYHGDCVEVIRGLPNSSIDYSLFSLPFLSLFVYSSSERDMGNASNDDEFWRHFRFLTPELFCVMKPGRLVSVHCMEMPSTKQNHGYIGLRNFRDDIVREFQSNGFIWHSYVTIWKDPVTAMRRTKALGLLHKQLVKDSCRSRMGIPDYVLHFVKPGNSNGDPTAPVIDPTLPGDLMGYVFSLLADILPASITTFRKPGTNESPVAGKLDHFAGDQSTFRQQGNLSIDIWQRYASPIWMDIDQSNVLQVRRAREEKDERHLCPLQLDVIERCLQLWSNPGDIILSPFAGIGSEIYQAVVMGRRGIGIELKKSYFRQSCEYMKRAEVERGLRERNLLTGIADGGVSAGSGSIDQDKDKTETGRGRRGRNNAKGE